MGSQAETDLENVVYDQINSLAQTFLQNCQDMSEQDGVCYWTGLNTDKGLIIYTVCCLRDPAALWWSSTDLIAERPAVMPKQLDSATRVRHASTRASR